MGVEFVDASSGQEALYTIEDLEPDLVLSEPGHADMHAWQVISRMRANQALTRTPVIIISEMDSQTDQVFAVSVAKVHDSW
jgi:DNA-binding response OmpR family regulator